MKKKSDPMPSFLAAFARVDRCLPEIVQYLLAPSGGKQQKRMFALLDAIAPSFMRHVDVGVIKATLLVGLRKRRGRDVHVRTLCPLVGITYTDYRKAQYAWRCRPLAYEEIVETIIRLYDVFDCFAPTRGRSQ